MKKNKKEHKPNLKHLDKKEEKKVFPKKKIIIYSIIAVFIVFFIWIIALNNKPNELNYSTSIQDGMTLYEIEGSTYVLSDEITDLVMIDVKDYGAMVAILYPDIAPITVSNFEKLVSEKFYDGLIFHRVIKDFMIQTGDPTGTGYGSSEEKIKGEFDNNGVENSLSHTRGVLSMARAGGNPDTEETMNSASSQFFIVHKDSTYLDGNYAAFGELINGSDVLDKIAGTPTDENDKPLKDQVINRIVFLKHFERVE